MPLESPDREVAFALRPEKAEEGACWALPGDRSGPSSGKPVTREQCDRSTGVQTGTRRSSIRSRKAFAASFNTQVFSRVSISFSEVSKGTLRSLSRYDFGDCATESKAT